MFTVLIACNCDAKLFRIL